MVTEVTKTLAPLGFPIPRTIEELLATEASVAGFHSIATWLGCPEQSRLRALGVKRKPHAYQIRDDGEPFSLDYRDYGQLIHSLLAVRVVYGQKIAEDMLARAYIAGSVAFPLILMEEDRAKAMLLLRTYDATFPLSSEPFRYIGVEVPVVADVGYPGSPIHRTARYDGVVQQDDPIRGQVVYSLEHKTASRGGRMTEYTPQAMIQSTLWNLCPDLVATYGPMVGVIFDVLVKTVIPRCERLPPRYITKLQTQRAIEYLRLPEQIKFPVNPDGSYPRLLNECFGRFQPCEFVDLCLDGSWGEYLWPTQG